MNCSKCVMFVIYMGMQVIEERKVENLKTATTTIQ